MLTSHDHEILNSSQSQLGKYLCGQKNITRSTASSLNHWVDIKKINGNNLQNIHITFHHHPHDKKFEIPFVQIQ